MSEAEVQITRWEGSADPSEATIREVMTAQDLRPYRWSNGPDYVYAPHQHGYHKILYVVKGDITFGLPHSGAQLQLRPGDRMDLPAGVVHDAVVGSQGVVCLEAHGLGYV